MGSSWFWNFSQLPGTRYMTEDDMRDIPLPATELGIHIAYKNAEAGSIIGGFLIAPLLPYIRKSGDLAKRKLMHRVGVCGRRGIFVGLLLTPVMEYGFIKAKNVTEEGLMDRCYRLRYNKKQLTVDRVFTVGGFFGFVANRWTGLVVGGNMMVFAATVFNATIRGPLKKYSPFQDEMDTPDPNYKPKAL